MKDKNIREIEKLWYRISKSTAGAVFNISQSYAEIIIGIQPPHVTNLFNTIKHYLKLIYDQPDCYRDPMISYVASELQKGENSIVNSHIKETFKFLEWKAEKYPNIVSPNDVHIIQSREFANFHYLMSQSCKYSKQMMTKYTEHLWKSKVLNKALLEGKTRIPCVRALPLPIPMGISRDDEVKLMSMFYNNNLLNSFLYKT